MQRPQTDEYYEYYETYISRVPDGDVIETLERQSSDMATLLEGIDEERANATYAEGKWTLKEVLGHVVDVERVFAYRAMAFARNDTAPIPGMDQDAYAAAAHYQERPLAEIAQEFQTVRRATIALLKTLDRPDVETRSGTASNAQFTVRAVAAVIAGHELHHVEVLKNRYL